MSNLNLRVNRYREPQDAEGVPERGEDGVAELLLGAQPVEDGLLHQHVRHLGQSVVLDRSGLTLQN